MHAVNESRYVSAAVSDGGRGFSGVVAGGKLVRSMGDDGRPV